MEINLSQAEANQLLAMEKHSATEEVFDYPYHGGSIQVPLQSPDKREQFILQMCREVSSICQKGHIRTGAETLSSSRDWILAVSPTVPIRMILKLLRRSFICTEKVSAIGGPFLIPPDFGHPGDPWDTLLDFMKYCNIPNAPRDQSRTLCSDRRNPETHGKVCIVGQG